MQDSTISLPRPSPCRETPYDPYYYPPYPYYAPAPYYGLSVSFSRLCWVGSNPTHLARLHIWMLAAW